MKFLQIGILFFLLSCGGSDGGGGTNPPVSDPESSPYDAVETDVKGRFYFANIILGGVKHGSIIQFLENHAPHASIGTKTYTSLLYKASTSQYQLVVGTWEIVDNVLFLTPKTRTSDCLAQPDGITVFRHSFYFVSRGEGDNFGSVQITNLADNSNITYVETGASGGKFDQVSNVATGTIANYSEKCLVGTSISG